jgi:hypothetical protein
MGENPSALKIGAETVGKDLWGAAGIAANAIANVPHAAVAAVDNLLQHAAGVEHPLPTHALEVTNTTPEMREFQQAVGQSPLVQNPVTQAVIGKAKELAGEHPVLTDVASDVANLLPAIGAARGIDEGLSALGAAREAAAKDAVPIPTKDELDAAATAAYKRAGDAGVVVTPQSVENLKTGVGQALSGDIVDPQLHPKATAVLNRVAATQGPQTLEQLDALRRVARDARAGATPDDSRLLGKVVDAIDDHVQGLTAADVTANDPAGAVQALQDARNLYSRYKKSDTIDQLLERARTRAGQFSGSGFENALRTEFRQLALNQKRLRTFLPEEQAAIKRVARGGPLANAARMLGKYAPTGVVSTMLGGGVGAAIGHGLLGAGEGAGVGAVALPALGAAGRDVAERLTMRNVERLQQLLRRGPEGSAPLTRPVSDALGDQVAPPTGMPFTETRPSAPGDLSPEQAVLANKLAGDLQLAPEAPGHGLSFEPSDTRLGDLQAATPAPVHGDIPFTSSEPLGTALAGNLELAQQPRAGGIAFRPTQPNPRAAGMAGDLALEPPPQAPARPLALPAPTRGPIAVDQAGRAAASPADVAAHRQAMGLDELGPGVRQPAAAPNPEREAAAAQARTNASQAVALTGKEITPSPGENIATLKQKAHAYAQGNFADKTVTNRSDGSQIMITKAGIDHAFSGKVSRKAALATAQLDRILENGKLVSTEADKAGRGDIRAVHQYDTPVTIAGKPAVIRSVVREHADGRRYYDHFEVRPDGTSGSRATSGAGPAAGADQAVRLGSEARPTAIDVGTEKSTTVTPKTVARAARPYAERSAPAVPDRAGFLSRFQQLSEDSPTNPAGRLFSKNVSVELNPEPTDDHTVHVEDLRALTTGQGHGAAALKKLTGLADRHGVRLTLDAHPLDKGGISKEKLVQFYQNHGFTPAADEWRPNLMVREPGGAK